MTAPRLGVRDALLVAVVCVAWAGNFFLSKIALREFPPLIYTALRLMLLTAVLAPFLKRPKQWPRLAAVGISNGVLHFGLAFWALKTSPSLASPAIVLQSYVPISALLAWAMRGEKINPATAAAIAISFSGVLVLGFDPQVLAAPQTLVLMLVSAFFLALGTVLMRGLPGLRMVDQQGWTAAVGIVPLLAWSALVEPGAIDAIKNATWVGWSGIIYAALVVSLLGHGLFYGLVQRHPVSKVTPYLLASPVITVILGIVFLGDRLGARMVIGGAMVLGGVFLLALRPKASSPAPSPAPVP